MAILLGTEIIGFERLKDDYESCLDFVEIFKTLADGLFCNQDDYFLQNGLLLYANKLCIPQTSVRDFIIWEVHACELLGHFRRDKTIAHVEEQFFWSSIKRDMANLVGQWRIC